MYDRPTEFYDGLIFSVLTAVHNSNIITQHMYPDCQAVGIRLSKGLITLSIHLKNIEKDLKKTLGLSEVIEARVAEYFGVTGENRLSITISREGKDILIHILSPEEPEPLLMEEVTSYMDGAQTFVGLDSRNQPYFHDFWDPKGSMIISGIPGSGKTNTMRFLVAQGLNQKFDGYLIAAKGIKPGIGSSEWLDFKPYFSSIAIEENEANSLLALIDDLCKQRSDQGVDQDTRGILLIIDEFFELTSNQQKELGRLIRLRRTAGLRVVLGIKVVSKQVAKDIRGSIGCRIVHRSASPIESQLASGGIPNLGGERLDKGCAILVSGPHTKRLVIPKSDADDITNILTSLSPRLASAPLTDPLEASEWLNERSLSPVIRRGVRPIDTIDEPMYTGPFGDVLGGWLANKKEKPNSKVPPRFLLLDALRYYDTRNAVPSFATLKAWNRAKTGSALSDRRCRAVRDGLAVLLAARSNLHAAHA